MDSAPGVYIISKRFHQISSASLIPVHRIYLSPIEFQPHWILISISIDHLFQVLFTCMFAEIRITKLVLVAYSLLQQQHKDDTAFLTERLYLSNHCPHISSNKFLFATHAKMQTINDYRVSIFNWFTMQSLHLKLRNNQRLKAWKNKRTRIRGGISAF